MYKAKINGVEISCTTVEELQGLLKVARGKKIVNRDKNRSMHLVYDVDPNTIKNVDNSNARKAYTSDERRAIVHCKKVSEIIELAKKLKRHPRNVCSSFYQLTEGR